MKSKSFTLLIVMSLLSVLLNASLFAQNSSFSFSFSGGSGFLPLLDVIDFTKTTPLIMDSGYRYDFFQKDNSGKYFDLKFVYHYTDKHRVSLNIEYITISAEGKTTHMGYNGYIGTADQDSKITAVPIGLSYEYVLGEHGKGFSLLFGAGPSLYISKKVRKELFYPIDDYDKPRYTEYSQTGLGSGLHFYLQLQQSLTTRMFILLTPARPLRKRIANCLLWHGLRRRFYRRRSYVRSGLAVLNRTAKAELELFK